MFVEKRFKTYPGEEWAFDNGAYKFWRQGIAFDEEIFLKRMAKARTMGTPFMAIAPDIFQAGKASLEFTLAWLPRLPQDWPWYIAIQDGIEPEDVEPYLHRFKGIFIGGSDKNHERAKEWADLAHKHGLKCHYGRAGTPKKMRAAKEAGADSCDSAFLLWTETRFDEYMKACQG
jgi:hypothetical protein